MAASYRFLVLLLALAALSLVLASGPGTRLEWWHFSIGFGMLRWAAYLAIAAAALALLGLAIPPIRARRTGLLVAVALVCAAVVFFPWRFQQNARAAPPINDISTDTAEPPAFVSITPRPPPHGGQAVAAQQRKAYPDIQPLVLAVPPRLAYTRAQDVARSLGWEIVDADAAAGRIEATATTFWFGFKDDVVIRVTPSGSAGSRVDVRSKSRVGRGDAGANAKRVRDFLAGLRAASGGP
jgi:uncharacterized protein (DUF1499 family)